LQTAIYKSSFISLSQRTDHLVMLMALLAFRTMISPRVDSSMDSVLRNNTICRSANSMVFTLFLAYIDQAIRMTYSKSALLFVAKMYQNAPNCTLKLKKFQDYKRGPHSRGPRTNNASVQPSGAKMATKSTVRPGLRPWCRLSTDLKIRDLECEWPWNLEWLSTYVRRVEDCTQRPWLTTKLTEIQRRRLS